jgi:TRAP-type C4-dicarboxylate transport system permease small subunit
LTVLVCGGKSVSERWNIALGCSSCTRLATQIGISVIVGWAFRNAVIVVEISTDAFCTVGSDN